MSFTGNKMDHELNDLALETNRIANLLLEEEKTKIYAGELFDMTFRLRNIIADLEEETP